MVEYGLATFAVGMLVGVIFVRYGINLGVKMVYKISDGVPLDYDAHPTEQEITGD